MIYLAINLVNDSALLVINDLIITGLIVNLVSSDYSNYITKEQFEDFKRQQEANKLKEADLKSENQ